MHGLPGLVWRIFDSTPRTSDDPRARRAGSKGAREAMSTTQSIDHDIAANLSRLSKPGVLTVRPGYEIRDHRLSGKQAIVATVHTKKAGLPKADALPDSIHGIPVDVREATPYQRLRAHDPAAAALAQAYGQPESQQPDWPYEREMPSGRLLAGADSSTATALAAHARAGTA